MNVFQRRGVLFLLVIGCVLLLFGVMWFKQKPVEPPFDPLAAHQVWMQLIDDRVTSLPTQATQTEIRAAREALTALKVTSEDREHHLVLVMALLAWEQGDATAEQRVRALTSKIFEMK